MKQSGENHTTNFQDTRWKPQDFLNTRIQKRGKTFFSSQKSDISHVDPLRKTQFRMNTRFLKDLTVSSSTPLKKEVQKEEVSSKLIHKSRKSVVRMEKSPYLTNTAYAQKMMRLLIPVQGPNESLKLSIKKYNDLNLRNAELMILKKSDSLKDRMKAYSNRIGLPEDSKFFIMNSRDSHIKEALIRRGWVQSGDKQSNLFHLKWVYKDEFQDYQRLQEGQLFNHFKNNHELTNKNSLRKNINRYPTSNQPYFPLSFDLEVGEDSQNFEAAYIKFQMFKVLNKLGQHLQSSFPSKYEAIQKGILFPKKSYKMNVNPSPMAINRSKYAENQLLYKTDISHLKKSSVIWTFFQNLYDFVCWVINEIKKTKPLSYSIFVMKKQSKDLFSLSKKIELSLQFSFAEFEQHLSSFYIIELLKLWYYSQKLICQSYGFQNVWIVKPTGVSRGSGITITSDLIKINQLKYGKIVQKYIQKPLLLNCKRKFDIRQWILVKSFSPLRAYAFKKCYARLSGLKYSNQNYDNLQKHLTNYSQNKDIFLRTKTKMNDNFRSKTNTPSPMTPNSVLSEDELSQQIPQWSIVKQAIMKNIIKTLNCCKMDILQRDQCFEVFGFDIILDSCYKPYVLEVNLSPACEKREFLEEYLYEMSQGLIDLFEGKDPSNWVFLSLSKLEEQQSLRQKLKEKEEKAIMIQRWWRKHLSFQQMK